jgi:hypothetical protein
MYVCVSIYYICMHIFICVYCDVLGASFSDREIHVHHHVRKQVFSPIARQYLDAVRSLDVVSLDMK